MFNKSVLLSALLVTAVLGSSKVANAQASICPSATNVSVSDTIICAGNPITLSATIPSGTNTVNWYTTLTGGTPIATTTSPTTTYIPQTAGTFTYYAEAVGLGGASGIVNYTYTGAAQTVTLQAGTYRIETWGANGYTQNAGYNGKGGYATGTVTLTSPQTYHIYVGQGGGYPTAGVTANTWTFNGGGIGYPNNNTSYGNGGGASDVRTIGGSWDDSLSITSRIIVAGGGGAGRSSSYIGGNGGGTTGATGTYFSPDQTGGPTGGSQTAGGQNTGYTAGLTLATSGKAMTWNGATLTASFLAGGGGGYYGGASGRVAGGGGSSYIGGVTSGTTIMFGQTGYIANPDASGNGYVRITVLQTCTPGPRVATATVTVKTSPAVNLGADISVCQAVTNSITLNANNAGATFLWNDNSTSQTKTVTQSGTYAVKVTNTIGCAKTDTIIVNFHASPVVNIGADTSLCADKILNLNAGNTGATYLWDNNTTNIARSITAAGTYFVKVTNANNCTTTDTIKVIHHPLPSQALGADIAVCKELVNNITLNAGNIGANYLWNDSTTNQTRTVSQSGSYNVKVTNNFGCIKYDTIVVNFNPSPIVNLGADTIVCTETALQLNAGNVGATFLWDNNTTTRTRTTTIGGTYYVKVTNNFNCSTTDTINIANFAIPQPNLGADTAICQGESIVLNPGTFRNYTWNTRENSQSIIAKDEATYFVNVKDNNGCIGIDSLELTIIPRAQAEGFSYIPYFYEQFGKVQYSVINPANIVRYDWSFGDGNTSTQANPTHIYTTPGSYDVTLNINGEACDPREYKQTINIKLSGTSIDDFNLALTSSVYPNPAKNQLNIAFEKEETKIETIFIFDALGRSYKMQQHQNGKIHTLDVSSLASGLYHIYITTNKGTLTSKVNIQR